MSFNATAVPAPSHVDLDDIKAIARDLYLGQVSPQEARVAVALLLHPEAEGLRQIEVASGLCDDTLLKIIPAEGFSSDLLTCRSRGSNSWELDDRRPMVVEHRTSVGRKSPISLESLRRTSALEEMKDYYGEEIDARQVSAFLDPSLDTWANSGEGLGDAGWTLAMVTGMRSMTFSLSELERILKVGGRQVRRILDKLGVWAKRVKEGRSVRVTVDMSLMALHEPKTARKARKAALAQCEGMEERARDTEVGRAVKEMWRDRLSQVRQLREYLEILPTRAHQRLTLMIEYLTAGRGEGPRARWRLRQLLETR